MNNNVFYKISQELSDSKRSIELDSVPLEESAVSVLAQVKVTLKLGLDFKIIDKATYDKSIAQMDLSERSIRIFIKKIIENSNNKKKHSTFFR